MPARDTLSKEEVDGGDEDETWGFPLGSTFKRTHVNVHPDTTLAHVSPHTCRLKEGLKMYIWESEETNNLHKLQLWNLQIFKT